MTLDSTFCIQMAAAITKRTVTWLSFLMTLLYFLSFREDKMVTVRPSMTTEWCDQSYFDGTRLYILYTDDCRNNKENSYLAKFADDSALRSLIQGRQTGHGTALDDFTEWCDESCLGLNVNNKTRDRGTLTGRSRYRMRKWK